jgi:AhpD family alkylhydroperoxidase
MAGSLAEMEWGTCWLEPVPVPPDLATEVKRRTGGVLPAWATRLAAVPWVVRGFARHNEKRFAHMPARLWDLINLVVSQDNSCRYCYGATRAVLTIQGFDAAAIARFEAEIDAHAERLGRSYRRGDLPPGVPAAYQAALERGWVDGMLLIQRIGANARYFTDSAGKVAIDVSMGDAAVGMAIDFYARYQAQVTAGPLGDPRMVYVTPVGGTSVSCDPIGLLRGAPHRAVALRFIEYVLGEDGQRLWTYLPGTPGGPERYALRRLPVRRDFYPSPVPAIQAAYERHRRYAADDLGDPSIDPYQVAQHFTYYPRWTARHFAVQREIIRAMALDSGEDLRAAWRTVRQSGRLSAGATLMRELPTVTLANRRTGKREAVPLTWRTAPDFAEHYDPLEYLREWTAAFRASYRAVARSAHAAGSPALARREP